MLVLGILAITSNQSFVDRSNIAVAGTFWQRTEVAVDEELLTVTTSGKDSTKVYQGAPYMVMSVIPGYTSSTPDSFYTDRDSTQVGITLRVWTDKARSQLIRNLSLFGGTFKMQVAATTANYDSASTVIASPDSNFIPYYDVLFTGKTTTGNGAKYIMKMFKYE